MNRKSLAVEWKDVAQGTFRAKFATLGVVDKDKDVTFEGAFPDGKTVPISAYGHQSWTGALPVGKGVISSDAEGAYIDGGFFLGTPQGQATYETLKQLGPMQEWSYGYQVLEASFDEAVLAKYPGAMRGLLKLDVFEVSPVLMGAGVDTQTENIKAANGATDLPIDRRDAPWNASAAAKSVRRWASASGSDEANDVDFSKYRQAFFWYDAENPEEFGSYKLGFAEFDNGRLEAVPRGIFAVAAVLQGSRGGVNIPAGDVARVKARVAGYYSRMRDDFSDDSIVPPWDDSGKALTHASHGERILADVGAFVDRVSDRAEFRAKEGRRLSASTRDHLSGLVTALTEAAAGLRVLLDEVDGGDSGKSAVPADVQSIYDAFRSREEAQVRQFLQEFSGQ